MLYLTFSLPFRSWYDSTPTINWSEHESVEEKGIDKWKKNQSLVKLYYFSKLILILSLYQIARDEGIATLILPKLPQYISILFFLRLLLFRLRKWRKEPKNNFAWTRSSNNNYCFYWGTQNTMKNRILLVQITITTFAKDRDRIAENRKKTGSEMGAIVFFLVWGGAICYTINHFFLQQHNTVSNLSSLFTSTKT